MILKLAQASHTLSGFPLIEDLDSMIPHRDSWPMVQRQGGVPVGRHNPDRTQACSLQPYYGSEDPLRAANFPAVVGRLEGESTLWVSLVHGKTKVL